MSVDDYLGEIRIWSGNYAPYGWEFCLGQLLPIEIYGALFGLIATTYGGDGQETFRLPDLCGRIPVHMGTETASGQTFVIGEKGGSETVALTSDQLPAHRHTPATTQPASTPNPTGATFASASAGAAYKLAQTASDTALEQAGVVAAGDSEPHANVMPTMAVNYIICLDGSYPDYPPSPQEA